MVLFLRKRSFLLLFSLFMSFYTGPLSGWGFYAHKEINRMAVLAVPPPLIGFYKQHIDEITVLAVQPDKRRYAVEGEAPNHYIDLDHYLCGEKLCLPRKWNDAVQLYSEDTLFSNGIVPWKIQSVYFQLRSAFILNDAERIVRLSADIGHYIADAHVPLHCTSNYNGQLTGQHGIHGLWESRIPELFGEDYDRIVGKADFIPDVPEYVWDIVLSSFAAVDSVLDLEKELSLRFPPDRKMVMEFRGKTMVRSYSPEYCLVYDRKLSGMVERRFRQSIHSVASFWYTAWVEAGQPPLDYIWENGKTVTDSLINTELPHKIKNAKGHVD